MKNKLIYIIFIVLFQMIYAQSEFDGEKAFLYLKKQVEFGPRVPGSEAHSKCQKYLVQFFRDLDLVVESQPFTHADSRSGKVINMTNIIVKLFPEKQKRILLCAHWDSRPFADEDIGQNRLKPVPGANDGASGVAVLMHLAEILRNESPMIGVDIVLFDGEDFGSKGNLSEYFLGSRYYAQHYGGIFPQFAILLDMVGDRNLNFKMEGYSLMYAPWLVKLVWQKAEELGYYQFEPVRGPYIDDDHVILNKRGIPAIDIIDFEYPNERNEFWHTLKDIPDNCSPESLRIVGDLLMRVILDTNWMRY